MSCAHMSTHTQVHQQVSTFEDLAPPPAHRAGSMPMWKHMSGTRQPYHHCRFCRVEAIDGPWTKKEVHAANFARSMQRWPPLPAGCMCRPGSYMPAVSTAFHANITIYFRVERSNFVRLLPSADRLRAWAGRGYFFACTTHSRSFVQRLSWMMLMGGFGRRFHGHQRSSHSRTR